MRTLVVVAAVALAPSNLSAQEALDLLNKAAATVRGLSKTSYDFEQVEIRDSQGPSSQRYEQRSRVAGSEGRYRVEPLPTGPLYLFDGRYRWAYNPERNEYTKAAGVPDLPANLTEFALAANRVRGARTLRQENVELATGPVVCQVVEAVADRGNDTQTYSPLTYWIDAARNLILKMEYTITFKSPERPSPSTTKVTKFFTKAAVGQPVEDTLFRFTPPDGAVEVERLTFGPKSALIGKDCPDFELKTVDGRTITRASLRGQVTLLSFGAAAQEDPLAAAEMTYRALRSSGLNVFYVAPTKFAAAGYTVPIAIDPGSAVAKEFGTREGLVLIDRFGKIAYTGDTSRGWHELAQALQQAGVW